ncbi:MAG: FkbM family methyltransferase [Phycisphaerae bacterium]
MSHVLTPLGRVFRAAARAYLQHSPVMKGKALVWDAVRWTMRNHQDLFPPCQARTRDGLLLNCRFSEWPERDVYFWGVWQPSIESLLRRFLRAGDVFIDVGANVGYFSLVASRLVGPAGRVVGFEPSPRTFEVCRSNIARNNCTNVSLYPVALADRAGELELTEPAGGSGLATLRPLDGTPSAVVARHKVRTVALDECLSPWEADRVRLVKIDVEGAEMLVLRGMTRLLARGADLHVICEVTDSFLRQTGASAAELHAFMREQGFEAFRIGAADRSPLDEQRDAQRNEPVPLLAVGADDLDAQPWQYDALFTRSRPPSRRNDQQARTTLSGGALR